MKFVEAPVTSPGPKSYTERVRAAAAIAASHADDVDARARFPSEAIEALKAARLLGVMLPSDLGGDGATLSEVTDICFALGRSCASTGLIYAMHQVMVACLVRHHGGSTWQLAFLRRLAADQLLLASSTTEGSAGGAVRTSSASVEASGGDIRLSRSATVVSYGEQADAIVSTARRDPDADKSDQVLVVVPRENYTLDRLSGWNTLGMRGTCSLGFNLNVHGPAEQVLATPYAEIHARTMVPSSHMLWSSVWAGIAAEAVERARMFSRKAAGPDPKVPRPGASHLTRAKQTLNTLCTLIDAALTRYEEIKNQPAIVESVSYQATLSLLKVQVSELAVSTVLSALQNCGLAGYRNDGDSSMGRLLRDILSAPLMISNDRILADLTSAALLDRTPTSLRPSFDPR